MMSSWKFTKKLKETHLSSPFKSSKSAEPVNDDAAFDRSAAPSNGSSASETAQNSAPTPADRCESSATRKTITRSGAATPVGSEVAPSDPQTENPSKSSDSQSVCSAASEATAAEPPQQIVQTIRPGLLILKIYNATKLQLPFKPVVNSNSAFAKMISGSSLAQNAKPLDEPHDTATAEPESLEPAQIPAVITIPSSGTKHSLVYAVIEFDKTVVVAEAVGGTVESPVFSTAFSFDISRVESLSVQTFACIPMSLYPRTEINQYIAAGKKPPDVFLGAVKLTPEIPSAGKVSTSGGPLRLHNHEWFPLGPEQQSSARICLTVDYQPNKGKSLTIDDFVLLKVIGKGSFGKVMQVKKKDTQQIYAMKTLRKAHIVSRSEVTHTLAERTVLARINNPFIVPLKFSFQSPEKLYLVLTFINGGELFHHLQREGRFDLNRARFYTAELLCALECLHEYNVIYRDLKPENILLDYMGHIALCDFGLCKLNMKDEEKTNTFCGTPEYLAPELLLSQGYTKVVDWWTLGVLLYEMLVGLPPFYDENVDTMYKKILQEPLRFPDSMDKDAKSILTGLLNRDPKHRLGVNGAKEIKAHPFFRAIDWNRLMQKGYTPPFKPPVAGALDTSNFDIEFTSEAPADSVVDDFLSESVQKQFGGWTYIGSEKKINEAIQNAD